MTDTVAKNLEWLSRHPMLSDQTFEASAFGIKVFYQVSGFPGNWTLKSPGADRYVDTPGYETQIDAKNAAQVDYERRVRAALL